MVLEASEDRLRLGSGRITQSDEAREASADPLAILDRDGGGKLAALHGRTVREARRERVEADRGAQIALRNVPIAGVGLRKGRPGKAERREKG